MIPFQAEPTPIAANAPVTAEIFVKSEEALAWIPDIPVWTERKAAPVLSVATMSIFKSCAIVAPFALHLYPNLPLVELLNANFFNFRYCFM
jgi:hypothetical protein